LVTGARGVLGVAAVDRPAQPAHQGRDLHPRGELPARAGLHNANALDPAHVGDLGPLALAHVPLGVIDPERFDLNYGVTGLGLGLRDFANIQHIRPAEMLPENRPHKSPLVI
jgi:hypothetical protein